MEQKIDSINGCKECADKVSSVTTTKLLASDMSGLSCSFSLFKSKSTFTANITHLLL